MQDLTDSDFDSESTDNESDLTDVTMPSQEIIRLLAQYCSEQKIWKRVRPNQFLNITSFEPFTCTYIKDRGIPEGAVLKILKVDP